MPKTVHSLRVEAVVLRHADWGEADRLLTLFTREQGKLRAIAKGARKLLSRKAGHLEPFTRVALMLAHGHDWWIVTQAEMQDACLPLTADLALTGYASYVVELLDRFTYEEGANPSLYRLLVETLQRLSQGEEPFLTVRYYELRLMDQAGFRPELFHCVNCKEAIQPQDQFFSALQGGVLCPGCAGGFPEARPVSLNALRFLRHLQRSSFAEARRADPSPGVRNEMESLLQYYITYVLERGLNTTEFLKLVR